MSPVTHGADTARLHEIAAQLGRCAEDVRDVGTRDLLELTAQVVEATVEHAQRMRDVALAMGVRAHLQELVRDVERGEHGDHGSEDGGDAGAHDPQPTGN